jgi:hypothetical protein
VALGDEARDDRAADEDGAANDNHAHVSFSLGWSVSRSSDRQRVVGQTVSSGINDNTRYVEYIQAC